jgi:hypothetical protein
VLDAPISYTNDFLSRDVCVSFKLAGEAYFEQRYFISILKN